MRGYIAAQARALESVPTGVMAELVDVLKRAWVQGRGVFAMGNGGSAANCSHFVTDLGKGASDVLGRRFRVMALNDNAAWMTALGNDYAFEEIFLGQLRNHAAPGDVLIACSVSGGSRNLVRAMEWAVENGLETVALVGSARGRLAEIARHVVVVDDGHYGRVEDVHMNILHMLCYHFMENGAGREA